MTKIKLCGLMQPQDVLAANALLPAFVGFVFAKESRRAVTAKQAAELKALLDPRIQAVGVFVNDKTERVADLLEQRIIDIAQLHGDEGEPYIRRLKAITLCPVIKAFCLGALQANEPFKEEKAAGEDWTNAIEACGADYVLLDSGKGSGMRFSWELAKRIKRPYFLAGGLDPDNAAEAVRLLHPFAVDVSSGIETDGAKDAKKMETFCRAVREA